MDASYTPLLNWGAATMGDLLGDDEEDGASLLVTDSTQPSMPSPLQEVIEQTGHTEEVPEGE